MQQHFGASLAWIRGNKKDFEEAEEVKGARTKHTDDSNSSSGNKRGPEESEKRERAGVDHFSHLAPIAFTLSLIALIKSVQQIPIPDGMIPTDAPHVDYDTFVEKYLKAREIQKITFITSHDKAVATLRAGTIMDGEQAKPGSIVINCPNRSSDEFQSDVSKVEAEMGISLAQGVRIEMLSLIPTWKKFVIFGGLVIFTAMVLRDCRSLFMRLRMMYARRAMK